MNGPMPVLAVHYAEIALKGGNRHIFMRRLKNNLGIALRGESVAAMNHIESRVLVRLGDPARAESALAKASRVFGVQWVSLSTTVPRAEGDIDADMAALRETAVALARRDVGEARHFKVECRRSDETFPLTSPEIGRIVGTDVQAALDGLPARMNRPDFTVHVLVLRDEILVFTRKTPGLGGLPVGSSGKVMALFSGGIDSPVAAWMMMKRGCRPDLVHFYSGRTPAEADSGKIEKLAACLAGFAPHPLNLHLVPSFPYEERAVGGVDDRFDMVLFRRYMFRTAARLARRTHCLALVAGDSVGQVASQTLHNLRAITPDLSLPVLRPLVGLDKVEITTLSRKMGAFEISITPYRDCCSLRSPHPVLNARPEQLLELSERIDLDGAVVEAAAESVRLKIGPEGRLENGAG